MRRIIEVQRDRSVDGIRRKFWNLRSAAICSYVTCAVCFSADESLPNLWVFFLLQWPETGFDISFFFGNFALVIVLLNFAIFECYDGEQDLEDLFHGMQLAGCKQWWSDPVIHHQCGVILRHSIEIPMTQQQHWNLSFVFCERIIKFNCWIAVLSARTDKCIVEETSNQFYWCQGYWGHWQHYLTEKKKIASRTSSMSLAS